MEAIKRKRAFAIGLRAQFPRVTRLMALFVLVAGLVFVGFSYYKLRNNSKFKMFPANPELSKEVKGIVEGYEQRITKNGRLYMWLRAARDITFADDHHELESVNLVVYPSPDEKPDTITSNRAIFDQKSDNVSFIGKVKIETKDALNVETESLTYNRASEVAQTDALMNFTRENVSGHSTGAVVEAKAKKLELKKDVEITVVPDATKEQKVKLSPTRTRPMTIHAAHALFEQEAKKLTFNGGVAAEQERDIMSGDNMYAMFNDKKRLQKLEVRGNSYLRSMDEGHAAEVHSTEMDFFLDDDQRLKTAVANGDTKARTLDADSEMQVNGAQTLEANFQAVGDQSLLQEMHTQGRSVVTLAAPQSRANDPRAASKRLTADFIKLEWRTTGRNLERAAATGNAELYIEPVVKNPKADRQTLTAQRFDCDFYETGNLARTFVATGGAKAVIDPVQPSEKRGTRTITSQKMTVAFTKETQDPERFDAQGDTKFNERDRNGTSSDATYTAKDDTVRLRGGEPTVWDSRARTKAIEMDSNLTTDITYSRGKTATTYYSQEQTNGATPFTKVKSPVYIVSERAEFRHDDGMAIYTGNARAWQDDNYVRSDELTIFADEKKMTAIGHVQSGLYNAKRKENGVEKIVPVFAASDSMWYSDPGRTLHYESNVDIRQATDRIISGVADVYLQKDSNEVERTVAQRKVVMTQPNRKATGEWIQYTTADDVAVLRGTPARVEDTTQGTTEGERLTVYNRENKVITDDARGQQSGGRARSTHKIQNSSKRPSTN